MGSFGHAERYPAPEPHGHGVPLPEPRGAALPTRRSRLFARGARSIRGLRRKLCGFTRWAGERASRASGASRPPRASTDASLLHEAWEAALASARREADEIRNLLAREQARRKALERAARVLAHLPEAPRALETLLEDIRRATGAASLQVYAGTPGDTLGAPWPDSPTEGTVPRVDAGLGRLVAERAWRRGEVAEVADLVRDYDGPSARDLAAAGVQSAVAIPLSGGDGQAGALVLFFRGTGYLPPDERAFAVALASPLAGTLWAVRLVREREAAGAELVAARRGLVHAEHRRHLLEGARGVLHDLRTILQVILVNTERGLAQSDAREARSALPDVVGATRDGIAISERFERLLRPTVGVTLLDPNDLVRATVALVQLRLQGREAPPIQTRVALQEVPPVRGHRADLLAVLLNLMTNAIEPMPAGGSLCVTTGSLDGRVRIAVTDSGSGIPPDLLGRLGEAPFTTKGEPHSGLGLAVSRQLVTAHRGAFHLASAPGAGTMARVELPAARLDVLLPGGEPLEAMASDLPRLLILHPDPELVGLLQGMLRQAGYHTEAAATVEAARRRLARERFPVVMLSLGPELEPLRSLLRDHSSALVGLVPPGSPRAPDPEVPLVLAAPYRLAALLGLLDRMTGGEAGPRQLALFEGPTPWSHPCPEAPGPA